jgi:hypothetical protein
VAFIAGASLLGPSGGSAQFWGTVIVLLIGLFLIFWGSRLHNRKR